MTRLSSGGGQSGKGGGMSRLRLESGWSAITKAGWADHTVLTGATLSHKTPALEGVTGVQLPVSLITLLVERVLLGVFPLLEGIGPRPETLVGVSLMIPLVEGVGACVSVLLGVSQMTPLLDGVGP